MKSSRILRRVVSSGLVGLAVISLFSGADDATQTVDAKGMKFEAPASWKASPPTSRMRN